MLLIFSSKSFEVAGGTPEALVDESLEAEGGVGGAGGTIALVDESLEAAAGGAGALLDES